MDLKALLPLAVQASLFLLVLSLGLRATPYDALYVIRRPRLLARALLAVDVIPPALTVLVALVFPLTPVVKIGLLLMAVSPMPPLVPGKQMNAGGNLSYVCGLLVAVSVLSIVTVPLTVAIVAALFPGGAMVSAGAIARLVAVGVILPLGTGVTLHALLREKALRVARSLRFIANIVLVAAVVPVLISVGDGMWTLTGNGTVLAIVTVVLAALAGGHFLGGPDETDRTALAIASATRHPGIALMIARTSFPGTEAAASLLLYVVVSSLAAVPYNMWRKRRRGTPPAVVNAGATHRPSPV